jgi:hypothetical protein
MSNNVTKVWTIESLQAELSKAGVEYTTAQLTEIGADLIAKGIIDPVV